MSLSRHSGRVAGQTHTPPNAATFFAVRFASFASVRVFSRGFVAVTCSYSIDPLPPPRRRLAFVAHVRRNRPQSSSDPSL